MLVTRSIADAVRAARDLARPIGLVPTMGALHAGHLALVERARRECASVIATIFVNPLQFGPNEDFARYPRAFPADSAQLETGGVALLFAPDAEAMYPRGFDTAVDPGGVATRYEGELRPGHFRGVATVCTKLFAIAGADRGYFGTKDAQQLAVLRQIVRDLAFPIDIVEVATIRESDGLALSSRNAYLSADERAAAPALYRALRAMTSAVASGETKREAVVAAGRSQIAAPVRTEYLDIVDGASFEPVDRITAPPQRGLLAIGSVWLGTTRLIDNVAIGDAA